MTQTPTKMSNIQIIILFITLAAKAHSFGIMTFYHHQWKNTCSIPIPNPKSTSITSLQMAYGYQDGRSKRQERVGHLVRNELANIINLGTTPLIPRSSSSSMNFDPSSSSAILSSTPSSSTIEAELRRRISIVNVDVSPDLRQARITVSIIGQKNDPNEMMDKRRAYSWLVNNVFSIRHELAKRLKHLKVLPNLTFVEVDVGSAVDVMNLIDKVSQGNYKRESLELEFDEDDEYEFYDDDDEYEGESEGDMEDIPSGMTMGVDLDDDGEDHEEWMDEEEEDHDAPIYKIEDL